ncbi:protein modification by small protein conjugation or removal [Coemansia asiatica]|uniref:Protein modification by small protein conjugation or removal n=1 Tax=Coemansia asiatica TaxID=1052880 RepID=A0A9W8CLV3_9FUNG|nr:protein modification by small protein conjugation or removal [Coemansia asiatica]
MDMNSTEHSNSSLENNAENGFMGKQTRSTVVDFGDLVPQYHVPMMFPNEVELYEPSLKLPDNETARNVRERGSLTVQALVDVALPCGYFNIWRPLHHCQAPFSDRLLRYIPKNDKAKQDTSLISQGMPWHSRVSYSSADDEYFQNGVALPYIKGWQNGTVHAKRVFRKVEHDWGMTYLAPAPLPGNNADNPSVLAWRFSYTESFSVIDTLKVFLGFASFSEQAAVNWYIRPLSCLKFKPVPVYLLTSEEAQFFPEIPHITADCKDPEVLCRREQIIESKHGSLLAYRAPADQHNEYTVLSLPGFLADLSQYVEGEHGFELAVEMTPARDGANRWQKTQIARQNLTLPVSGRMREGEDALSRCGLDVQVRLRPNVAVDKAPIELLTMLADNDCAMDSVTADFTIYIDDPSNTIGCLQPPIRAHANVLGSGSEYFAAMLASSMTETMTRQVELSDMPYGAVRIAINFLYTGTVADANARQLEDWIRLLGVSTRLSITRLHQVCQAHILQIAISRLYAEKRELETDNTIAGYQQLAEFPCADLFDSLQIVATENGAYELLGALERIVKNYPVARQEHAMRCGPTELFLPQEPRAIDPELDADQHAVIHGNFRGPGAIPGLLPQLPPIMQRHFARPGDRDDNLQPESEDEEEDNSDNGSGQSEDENDHSEEEARRHEQQPRDGLGFFAQFFGHGWRITNVDDDPPAPQPGPVPAPEPELEMPTATSTEPDDEQSSHTITQNEQHTDRS